VGPESVHDINRLRAQARKLGVAIRTQRAPGVSGSRAYRLVDRETGHVFRADLSDLTDVQRQLWWILRKRRRSLASPLSLDDMPAEQCPACGRPRVAFFRLCLSCGLDYEASREPTLHMAAKPTWKGPNGRLVGDPKPVKHLLRGQPNHHKPMLSWLPQVAHDVRNGDRFVSLIPLAGGAVVALVAGAIVALVLGSSR